MVKTIDVCGRKIGPGYPCFIIAEAGVNHSGDIKLAKKLIDVAKEAGANAVKFQTFVAEKVATADAPKADYQKKTTGSEGTQLEMVKRLELSFDGFRKISAYCHQKGIIFMSTPFDEESADFLDELGVPGFKIASGEITNLPFLEHIARKGKPIILSTGMSYLSEVDEAVRFLRNTGCDELILLHCVSNYPAEPADANLRAMQTMAIAFQLPVGYSDHTLSTEVALAAVALGACVIEKHFTLDKGLPGPDHRASLEPNELNALVRGVRLVEQALGHGRKVPAASEDNTLRVVRRSLALRDDLEQGVIIEPSKVTAMRPAGGIPPNLLPLVVGRCTTRPLKAGTLLRWEDLA